MSTYQAEQQNAARPQTGFQFKCRAKTKELTLIPVSYKFLSYFCSIITAMIIYISLEESAQLAFLGFVRSVIALYVRPYLRELGQNYIRNAVVFNVVLASLPLLLTYTWIICSHLQRKKKLRQLGHHQNRCAEFFQILKIDFKASRRYVRQSSSSISNSSSNLQKINPSTFLENHKVFSEQSNEQLSSFAYDSANEPAQHYQAYIASYDGSCEKEFSEVQTSQKSASIPINNGQRVTLGDYITKQHPEKQNNQNTDDKAKIQRYQLRGSARKEAKSTDYVYF